MAEFIKISRSFFYRLKKDELSDGHLYINIQSIISINVYKNMDGEHICQIKTIDMGDDNFMFNYDKDHPEWKELFSRLNK